MERRAETGGTVALEKNVKELDSAVLARLFDEVRNGQAIAAGAYNRMHNRHNR